MKKLLGTSSFAERQHNFRYAPQPAKEYKYISHPYDKRK